MGNEQSIHSQGARTGLLDSAGFQVLKVAENSIAAGCGLEPYFDFICGLNGHQIEDGNDQLFVAEIQNCAGRSVRFAVFSAKGQTLREVVVDLPAPADGKVSLGLSLQWAPLATSEIVFHVLDVQAHSPASKAGLQAGSDYILGIEGFKLQSEDSLAEVLEENQGRELTLQVYNHDYNTVRLSTIVPDRNWGGEGLFGCGIGFGLLHQLPEWTSGMPVPGETIFSADDEDGDEDPTAAALASEPTPIPLTQTEILLRKMHIAEPDQPANPDQPKSPSPPPSARRKHHHPQPNAQSPGQLDAYFNEQEKLSKEADYSLQPSAGTAPLPPPPKDSEIRKASVDEAAAQEDDVD